MDNDSIDDDKSEYSYYTQDTQATDYTQATNITTKTEINEALQIDKSVLVNDIKEWITMEKEIKILHNELKKRRAQKKELTKKLARFMKHSDTDKFETKQGNINYGKQKKIQTIGKKFLIQTVGTYFNDDPYLAKDVIEYILDNRRIKEEDVVRFYIPKKKNIDVSKENNNEL